MSTDPSTGLRRFEMRRCLGKGGFGEVYLAKMASPGGIETDVAVKMLHRNLDPDGQALQRLKDEGRMLARVDHPVVLKVHDLVPLDGHVALITEYVDGEDLAECIHGADPIGTRALLQTVARVAEALDAAWNGPSPQGTPLRLVHRDIKPSNIRISRHGAVKLLDFGIARSDEVTREARTATDMMIGSLAYMAPERFLEPKPHPASDVFALGCVLYEGTTRDRLLGGLSVTVQMGLSLDESRYEVFLTRRLQSLPADLDPDVRALIQSALAYDPALRPTAADFAHRCELLADHVGSPPLTTWCRRRKWPEPPSVEGAYNGVLLVEGTLVTQRPAPPDVVVEEEEEPRGSGLPWLVGAGVAGLAVLGLGGVAIAAVAGILLFQAYNRDATSPPVPEAGPPAPPADEVRTEAAPPEESSAEGLSPESGPTSTPNSATAPTRVSRPTGGGPPAAPATPPPTAVVVDAAPETPAPRPVIAEIAPSRPTPDGRVAVQSVGGAVELELLREGRTYNPGSVPPGRYTLRAFGGDVGMIDVPPGGTVQVRCNALRQTCEAS